MTKTSSRAKKRARVSQKPKRAKTRATKATVRKRARPNTPVAKKTRGKEKPATPVMKSTASPGLPPGYFDRIR